MSTAVAQLTTTALLEGLFDPANQELWRHFDERYRPVIIAFARRLGVEPTDAADIAQETLVQFLRDYREGKYDRNRGRLHCWIIGIAKHRIADQFRMRTARREKRGESAIMSLPDEDRLDRVWDEEFHRSLVEQAMRQLAAESRVSPRTLDIFRMHVLEGHPPEEVAKSLQTSVRAVYLAKHRCLDRLRATLERLERLYDAP